MNPRIAILAAALGAAMLTLPAAAQSSVSVKYMDLDLSTPAGRTQLDQRIDAAAREACGLNEQRTGSRLPGANAQRCYTETLASVHKQVADAIARTGRSVG